MRLIACHIDGFGKLSDVDFSFEPGLNTFLQDNGWGKSTLAAYLRVMLYGFEGEGKRSDLENERRKYVPWNRAAYGGNLTFSVGDKKYVVYRKFGAKAKEDTFSLIDADTNLVSHDYSEYLGEELFQIDQASFKRTAFTEQQDLATGGTDSISAKLSNLCEDTDDLNNFVIVRDFLTKKLNNMSPSRVTGSIYALNAEISGLKVALNEKSQVENSINELTMRIQDKKKSDEAFKTEKQKLKELELVLIKQESKKALREQRRALQKEKEHREEAFRLAVSTVPGIIPEESDIEEAKKQLRHINNMDLQLAEKRVSEEEMLRVEELDMVFAGGIPEDEELRKIESLIVDFQSTEKRAEVLQAELKQEQDRYTEKIKEMGARLKRIQFRRVYGAVIFFMLVIAESLLFFNKSRMERQIYEVLAWGVLALGLLIFSIFLIGNEVSMKKASVMPAPDRRDKKEKEVSEVREELEELRAGLNAFFSRFGGNCEPATYAVMLNSIERDKAEYLRLSDKVTYAEKSGVMAEKKTSEEKIKSFLGSTGMYLTGDYQNDLQHLSVCCRDIKNAERELLTAAERLDAFESENRDYDEYGESSEEIQYTLPEIREKIRNIEANIKDNEGFIKQEEKRRDELLERIDELSEKETVLSEKLEKLEEQKKKYKIYEQTLLLLTKSHDQLNARLLEPLSTSFREYLKKMGYEISGSDRDKVYVDSNAAVTIYEAGDRRDLKFFSAGIKDLIAVAMRMALLDNMYEHEKPFVILDDPFVNLDKAKISTAKAFLQDVAERYQVLYFTCIDRFV